MTKIEPKAEGAIRKLEALKHAFDMKGANATTIERAIDLIRSLSAIRTEQARPGAWPLRELLARAMAFRAVGDPDAKDVNGKSRWHWYEEDAQKFIDLFGYALAPSTTTEERRQEFVDDGITDGMLNAGQERLCQIASRTHFDDYEEAEKYKAMRGEDPIFKAAVDYMRDTQTLPLEECAKLFSLRLKALRALLEGDR